MIRDIATALFSWLGLATQKEFQIKYVYLSDPEKHIEGKIFAPKPYFSASEKVHPKWLNFSN
ncbi:hypothetical protein A2246_01495 [candidate division WOR-1 bacterium RIFOXYA2_FULL_37_7]|uniref:Uncharacterized protein n=1 Tax=candidate division WOR-1 bacterium RIFOXYB2_FULL_37_13 TaxID=1802579 RepID=A0A1F4SV17_UNCSA|nr:MAG: hypothetical protein A2246_01495 [candidate division WOR-1 bacterium RIFOXYA2_FULL_37_7]OGC24281.1 MAG: hypothetical protein A2310_08135 [candidate division WOR-1 bacterium RIFOXYB2_FULL_37_13]